MINSKLFELQRVYGEPNGLKILEPNREYIDDAGMHLFWKNSGKPVTTYFMSDMILVSERKHQGKNAMIGYLNMNSSSMCKDLPDTKAFKNLFLVIGENDSLTFYADLPEYKERFMSLIGSSIQNLRDKNEIRDKKFSKHQITVTILGTE